MKAKEYLNLVDEQIRQEGVRDKIRQELSGHIDDLTEEFMEYGLSFEEAAEQAVEEMGDPVEAGMELDRVHQPRLDFKLLGFMVVLGLMVPVLQWILLPDFQQVYTSRRLNNPLIWPGTGILIMVIMAVRPYLKKLEKHPYQMWTIIFSLGIVMLGIKNGSGSQAALIGCILCPYAGLLFHYRKGGKKELCRLLLLAILPCLLLLFWGYYSFALLLLTAHAVLVTAAVRKNWYRVNRHKFLGGLWVVVGSLLAASGGYAFWKAVRAGFGSSAAAYLNLEDIPGLLLQYGGAAGKAAAALWALLFLTWMGWMLYDIHKMSNSFCRLMCLGVVLAFVVTAIQSVLNIFALAKPEDVWFPFFSASYAYSGAYIYIYFVLMGFFLNLHRFERTVTD